MLQILLPAGQVPQLSVPLHIGYLPADTDFCQVQEELVRGDTVGCVRMMVLEAVSDKEVPQKGMHRRMTVGQKMEG